MRGRDSSLINEIERGALDSRISLADTLRKCVALGGRARSDEMRTWASRELSGYGLDDELPEWRTVPAPVQIDAIRYGRAIRGHQISTWDLPDFVRDTVKEEVQLRMGVAELEEMLKAPEGHVRLSPSFGADLVAYLNDAIDDDFQQIQRFYWSVSTKAVLGVLDRIRTTLTELVAELRAGMPDNAEVPSSDLASQAVQIAVHGRGNRVTVNTSQAGPATITEPEATAEPDAESPAWKRWAKIGGFIVGVATIIATVVGTLQYFNS